MHASSCHEVTHAHDMAHALTSSKACQKLGQSPAGTTRADVTSRRYTRCYLYTKVLRMQVANLDVA
jgi:hypothetical protein